MLHLKSLTKKYTDDLPRVVITEKMFEGKTIQSFCEFLAVKTDTCQNQLLAGRLISHSLHEDAPKDFNEYLKHNGSFFQAKYFNFMRDNSEVIDKVLKSTKDQDIRSLDIFGILTFRNKYLLKNLDLGKTRENRQQCLIRVAVQNRFTDGIEKVIELYYLLLNKSVIFATPNMTNSCRTVNQLASCFLNTVQDNLPSILSHLTLGGVNSKNRGATGWSLSKLRSTGSKIGTDGISTGVGTFAYLYDKMIKAINQNGTRPGAGNVYLSDTHKDLLDMLKRFMPTASGDKICDKLDFTIWWSWAFFKHWFEKKKWPLFDPKDYPELDECYGVEFITKLEEMKKNPKFVKEATWIDPDVFMSEVCRVQKMSSHPFMLCGDSSNFKSNQKNAGKIRNSNLCTEIIQYSGITKTLEGKMIEEAATCNLGQVSVRAFVKSTKVVIGTQKVKVHKMKVEDVEMMKIAWTECYDFDKFGHAVRFMTESIDNSITLGYDNSENVYNDLGHKIDIGISTKYGNENRRPMALGISGKGMAEKMMDLLPCSLESMEFSKILMACMYYNANLASIDMAVVKGPHKTFKTTPTAKGKFQFDLWQEEYEVLKKIGMINERFRRKEDDLPVDPKMWGQKEFKLSNGYIIKPTWGALREAMIKFGRRNSLLIGPMPCSSTSAAIGNGNSENFEYATKFYYKREDKSGEFLMLHTWLEKELTDLGIMNGRTTDFIVMNMGSFKDFKNYFIAGTLKGWYKYKVNTLEYEAVLSRIEYLEKKYKTMFEIKVSDWVRQNSLMARYIDQSMSMNIFLPSPTESKLKSLHKMTFASGLKTMMYYLRSGIKKPSNKMVDLDSKDVYSKIKDVKELAMIKEAQENEKKRLNSKYACVGCDGPDFQ